MHGTGMVKICMVLATLMRHRDRSIAPNAGYTAATHKKRKKSKKLETRNGSHSGSKVRKVHTLIKMGVAYIFHAFVRCFCTI